MEDMTAAERENLVEGMVLMGRKLREWRAFAGLHLLKAEILNADGVISITCQADDTVTVRDGDQFVDITSVLDRAA